MKNIKILLCFAVCYVVINLFHLSSQLIYFDSWKTVYESALAYEDSFFGKSSWLIQNVISLTILVGISYTCIALFKILKNGYFNIITSKSFKIGGLLLCFVAILDFVRAVLEISADYQSELHIGYLMVNGLLFLIGFGILIISQIIKKGTQIQSENDLTI